MKDQALVVLHLAVADHRLRAPSSALPRLLEVVALKHGPPWKWYNSSRSKAQDIVRNGHVQCVQLHRCQQRPPSVASNLVCHCCQVGCCGMFNYMLHPFWRVSIFVFCPACSAALGRCCYHLGNLCISLKRYEITTASSPAFCFALYKDTLSGTVI